MQFLGNIEAKLDAKSRVFVPAAFRKILQSAEQNVLVLRKDIFQDCLVLYPMPVWEEQVALLSAKATHWDGEKRQLLRRLFFDTERLDIDPNGRILIPKRYVQMIGVLSDIRFLGVGDTIEIWAKDRLEDSMNSINDFGLQIQKLMGGNDER
ncbi:MraZ protein [Dysgonomonas sp. PH5-45]|uniref:division/cell wall cluster transcriptional repressor MraZ n=1 Tax=unclassified Dysgonomonas TaxID=2630389 RepID=UPI0024762185|nr:MULTISPECIES: cell division/cell wall cluster transcriptional repressor MraZ [unclassified Dysgonomonas]MDH6355711.1 MraZ protein [Dysgonomonas sp. PH5-45]MDH6388608.1 MraZ protein [Dysgonomonas sp. PH5-37]